MVLKFRTKHRQLYVLAAWKTFTVWPFRKYLGNIYVITSIVLRISFFFIWLNVFYRYTIDDWIIILKFQTAVSIGSWAIFPLCLYHKFLYNVMRLNIKPPKNWNSFEKINNTLNLHVKQKITSRLRVLTLNYAI